MKYDCSDCLFCNGDYDYYDDWFCERNSNHQILDDDVEICEYFEFADKCHNCKYATVNCFWGDTGETDYFCSLQKDNKGRNIFIYSNGSSGFNMKDNYDAPKCNIGKFEEV